MLSSLDLGAGEALFAAGVLFLAAYVRGYSGFGFSAVLVAGMTFIVEPLAAVPLAIAFEVVASMVQGRSVWHEIRWPDFWVLLAAAVVGNPIGVWILTTVDPDVLRGITLVVLLLLSVGMLVGHEGTIVPTTTAFFVVGTVAGVVNGATALSGLVLVLAMTFMVISPGEMRATLVAYFFASDLVVLGILWARDEITDELIWRVIAGLPLLAIGIAVGSRAFRGSSPESFRRNTLGLLVAISVVGLIGLWIG
ncbi:MAG: sulfite exporter TauE/SafE family protein [Acidimicrobiales bacterium]